MKFKSLIAAGCACVLLTLCACTKTGDFSLDSSKLDLGYSAVYTVSAQDGVFVYDNAYTVKTENGFIVISSEATESWTNGKQPTDEGYRSGDQIIKTMSKLTLDGNKFGMPVFVEEEFSVTADESYYTYFSFDHNHDKMSAVLKIKEADASSETGFKETTHAVALKEQYYDKDSLPFILGAFPDEAVTYVSSGNRDSLQAIKVELLKTEDVTVEAGTFTCKKYRLRPNVAFSVNSATVWLDSETLIPVKILHDSSVTELKSLTN